MTPPPPPPPASPSPTPGKKTAPGTQAPPGSQAAPGTSGPDAAARAAHFLQHETAFRLGELPTEQPHPRTAGLAELLAHDAKAGLGMLLDVDRDLPPVAQRVFESDEYRQLEISITEALLAGRRLYFTGCGATGRLAILLEASWRRHWTHAGRPDLADRVRSVMAGGDFALIRSVEGFEDFQDFGRHQLRDAGVGAGDVVVAVTEGGETSFVIGTAWQALDADAHAFFVFNNPADLLHRHVDRSRRVLDEPRITRLDLATGPMAVAGSTRMQATTIELLVLGTALEAATLTLMQHEAGQSDEDQKTAADTAQNAPTPPKASGASGGLRSSGAPAVGKDHAAAQFAALRDTLTSADNLAAMAALTTREAELYRRGGLVTYFADAFLLDILTDTTERSPTFSLPPFRPAGNTDAARSWSFVKDPLRDTPEAWAHMLGRPPGGLDWDRETYAAIHAPAAIQQAPPDLSRARILTFRIGDEPDPSRTDDAPSLAVRLLVGDETTRHGHAESDFAQRVAHHAASFDHHATLAIGPTPSTPVNGAEAGETFHIRCQLPASPLALWDHLAAKLVLNTISTASMGILGRLTSNWMVYVNTSNKKLIDRGVRLIADQTGVDYDAACHALFEMLSLPDAERLVDGRAASPVAVTIERIRSEREEKHQDHL